MVESGKFFRISGPKLAIEREKLFETQEEFAKRSGISLNSLGKIEPKPVHGVYKSTARKLAKGLGLEIEEFKRRVGVDSEQQDGVDPRPGVINPIYEIEVSATIWVHVPIAELDTNDPHQRAILEDGRFQLRIVGDCMEPDFPSGSRVQFRLIRSDDEAMPVGYPYVFCNVDGTATFKLLVAVHGRYPDTEFELAAINQQKYPGTFLVSHNDVGRVGRAEELVTAVEKPRVKIRR